MVISVFLYQEARRKEAIYLYEKLYLQYLLEGFNDNFKTQAVKVSADNIASIYSQKFFSADNPYIKLDDNLKHIRFINASTRDGRVISFIKGNGRTPSKLRLPKKENKKKIVEINAPESNETNDDNEKNQDDVQKTSPDVIDTNEISTNTDDLSVESGQELETTSPEEAEVENSLEDTTDDQIPATNVDITPADITPDKTEASSNDEIVKEANLSDENIIPPPPLPLKSSNTNDGLLEEVKTIVKTNNIKKNNIKVKRGISNRAKEIAFIELFYKKRKYRIYFR